MAGPLDDLLPIRQLMLDGVKVPFAPVLEFGTEFETAFTESAEGPAQNKVTVNITPASIVDLIPDATNASDGLATAAQITMLEDHETRVDALEAGGTGVSRTGTVDLSAAQAWADLGLPIAIDASTTSAFSISLQVATPSHTYDPGDGVIAYATQTVLADVGVAVTRDGASVCTVAQLNGGSSWAVGRVSVRAINDGAAGWQIQIQRGAVSVESPRVATVTATVHPLTTDAWAGDDVVAFESPDGSALDVAADLATHLADVLEAPTASTVPRRNSTGGLRARHYKIETDTDADRRILSRRLDGTTVDEMAIDATSVVFSDADGVSTTLAIKNDAGTSTIESLEQPLRINATGVCAFDIASELAINSDSQICASTAGSYETTTTFAAAKTIVHNASISSLTDRIAQKGAGAGAPRYILGGLGAAGSANGVFVSGLENGNTVLGGANWASVGSLVADVSDPFSVGVGTPGSLTSILDVYQLSANYTRIGVNPNALNIFAAGALTISTNTAISISSATDTDVSADVWYRRTAAGAYLRRTPAGSFGPIASATTTTVFSYTTLSARIYDVVANVVVTNDTDNEGASYYLRAAFKNIAGTVTQIGATQTIAADLEDAGQAGLSCTLDFSGTALRVRLTTDAGDTVNGTYIVDITERVQA